MPSQLTSIQRFPVKSLRGESLTQARVDPWGLDGDRRWMLVDETGQAVTVREINAMLLVRPELTGAGLRVEADGHAPLEVTTPDPAEQVPVAVFNSETTGALADAAAHAWFSEVLGHPLRLVHLDDPRRRTTDPRYSEPHDRVSFADGFPLLLTTESSLAALNEVVVPGSINHEPLSMRRFRPNLVVAGTAPWAEDDWRRIRIGEAVFRAVKGCARCVTTTVDPETAVRGKEPIASLARIRRWDGATWFGINLVPDSDGVRIQVGDQLEVLEAVEPGAGPLRRSTA